MSLARFDGRTFSAMARPPEMSFAAKDFAIESLSAMDDGTLWMTERAGKKLWRRKPDGSWAGLSLPAAKLSTEPNGAARAFVPKRVLALPSGVAWVTGCFDTGKEPSEDGGIYPDAAEELKVNPDCGAYFVKPR